MKRYYIGSEKVTLTTKNQQIDKDKGGAVKKETYIWIFLFFLSIFSLVSSGRFGGDGLENYLTAQSIVRDHNLSIYDKPFDIKEMRYQERGKLRVDGQRVSSYGLGMALLIIPLYFIGHLVAGLFSSIPHEYVTQFFASFTNPIISALLSLILIKLLLKLGYSIKVSFAAVFIYSFCTMNLAYSRSGFAEPAVALLAVLAAYELLSFSKNGKGRALLIAGICIGYAIFIKKNSLILLPGFAAYFLYLISCCMRNPRERKSIPLYLAYFFLPVALSFIMVAV
jgi:hypothetical protein